MEIIATPDEKRAARALALSAARSRRARALALSAARSLYAHLLGAAEDLALFQADLRAAIFVEREEFDNLTANLPATDESRAAEAAADAMKLLAELFFNEAETARATRAR